MIMGFLSRSLSRRSSTSSASSASSDHHPQSRAGGESFNPSPAMYWHAPCATAPFYVSQREARKIERNYQKMLQKGMPYYPRS